MERDRGLVDDDEKPCASRDVEKESGDKKTIEKTKRRKRSHSRSTDTYSSCSNESAREEKKPASKPAPLAIHEGTRKMQLTRKKPSRRIGRVTKRRRPNKIKRKPVRRTREVTRSVSEESLTSHQSDSSVRHRHLRCKNCGHRCCLRRFEATMRRLENECKKRRFTKYYQERRSNRSHERRVQKRRIHKSNSRRVRKRRIHKSNSRRVQKRRIHKSHSRRVRKRKVKFNRRVEKFERQNCKSQSKSRQLERTADSAQVGAPCPMLSKLFVGSSSAPDSDPAEDRQMYSQISPEMIEESLRVLTMLREAVPTEAIYDYIKRHYPVNPDPSDVMSDLFEKLHIACLAGIVWEVSNGTWRLTEELEKMNKLDKTHVTLFWQAYADTMSPLDRSLQPSFMPDRDDKGAGSNETLSTVDYTDEDAII